MGIAVDVVVPGHTNDPVLFTSNEFRHPVEENYGLLIVSLSSSGADVANHQYCVARPGFRHHVTQIDKKTPRTSASRSRPLSPTLRSWK